MDWKQLTIIAEKYRDSSSKICNKIFGLLKLHDLQGLVTSTWKVNLPPSWMS